MRANKSITVTLGPQQAGLNARLKSGRYATASEVLRSALRALDREEALLDEILRQRVATAMRDPRPSRPAADVFRRLRARHAKAVRGAKRGT